MWRRLLSSHLKSLSSLSSSSYSRSPSLAARFSFADSHSLSPSSIFLTRHFSSGGPKKVEDVMPIATGHEREELQAELEGRDILEIDKPEGPFGTKEAPAVIKSYYDRRIVGCPGGEGEDEHDVVWFWLKKDQPHVCPVCSQYFVLEVVGPGGPPNNDDVDVDGLR